MFRRIMPLGMRYFRGPIPKFSSSLPKRLLSTNPNGPKKTYSDYTGLIVALGAGWLGFDMGKKFNEFEHQEQLKLQDHEKFKHENEQLKDMKQTLNGLDVSDDTLRILIKNREPFYQLSQMQLQNCCNLHLYTDKKSDFYSESSDFHSLKKRPFDVYFGLNGNEKTVIEIKPKLDAHHNRFQKILADNADILDIILYEIKKEKNPNEIKMFIDLDQFQEFVSLIRNNHDKESTYHSMGMNMGMRP